MTPLPPGEAPRCQGPAFLDSLDPDEVPTPFCRGTATEELEGWVLCAECAEALGEIIARGPPWPWE